MKKKTILTVLILAILCQFAMAQEDSSDWQFVIAPYGLLANIDGEAGVGRLDPMPVAVDFGTLLKNLQMGVMMHSEVTNGTWGAVVDFAYMSLGSDATTPVGGVLEADVQQLVLEAFLSRRFGMENGSADVFAGIRYWDLDIDLSITGQVVNQALNRGESWIDPVVGGRLIRYVSEKLFFMLRGDIGGFSVGSDFSWNLQGGLGYDVADWFSLVGQYRALDVDFEDGEANSPDFFLYDTTTHGPLVGLVFRF